MDGFIIPLLSFTNIMCIHKLTLRQPLVKHPTNEAPRIERSPSPGRVSGGSRRVPGEKTAGPKKDYNIWDIIWEIIRINWDYYYYYHLGYSLDNCRLPLCPVARKWGPQT